ncbi:MAG: AMP-binding protein [Rhodocyclaceae bacterium]|nr:AMP-binding protein [Rhodocyclaceae bacterium]
MPEAKTKPIAETLGELAQSSHWAKRKIQRDRWLQEGAYPGMSLGALVEAGVARTPDARIMFASAEGVVEATIAELHRQARAVASGYRRLGLRQGDVIAIQLPNMLEGVVAFLAALHAGMIAVPIIHIYGAAELDYILRNCQATALVLPGQWKKIDFAARVAGLGDLPHLRHILVVGEAGAIAGPTVAWSELLKEENFRAGCELASADPDEACVLLYTSGTSAAPKGVVHTHNSIAAEVPLFPIPLPAADGAPILWPTPAGHIVGVVAYLRPFFLGENAIVIDQYDVDLAAQLMMKYHPDRSGGVPFQLSALFARPDAADLLRGMRHLLAGAAGIPPSLIEQSQGFGVPATRSYGCTEHPTICGAQPEDPLAKRAYTDGRLLRGSQIRLVDDNGDEVAPGMPGEIHSLGPQMFAGYLEARLNSDAFTPEGWFRTGDIGVLDPEGYLTIVDRKKDIIIRGGENVSSKEVEDLMATHPDVMEVAAVAWPDAMYGEKVGVFVRLKPGTSLNLEQIGQHFAAAGVARQKTPEHLVVLEEFPRNAMGKIVKPRLRELVVKSASAPGA